MRQKRPKPIAAFFPKLPQLLLAGAMFSAGLAACMGVSILVSLLTGFNNIILWGTGMIPGMIFYAGLVAIIRKYAIEGDYVPVIPTFVSAVRQNWKAFLLHGFVTYTICSCALFASLYYFTLAQGDVTFGYVMSIYGVFTAALLIMMFYVPVMTVTYELRWRDIYKNALLMIFGQILRNLLARPWRFNELQKNLEGISQKVLTDSLRSMEADGIVTRTVYPEVPPRVEYALSPLGETMRPILDAMEAWGDAFKAGKLPEE